MRPRYAQDIDAAVAHLERWWTIAALPAPRRDRPRASSDTALALDPPAPSLIARSGA